MTVRDNRCKEYEFIRFGPLSSIKQEWFKHRDKYYHASPVRHGIFVMAKNHFCMDLVYHRIMDKDTEKRKPEYRKAMKHIRYRGKIWTHYFHPCPEIKYYRHSGSWWETDTDYIDIILNKEKIMYNKQFACMYIDNDETKAHSFAALTQKGRKFIWWDTEFFIERI